MSPLVVLAIVGAAVVLYYGTGGSRTPVAHGRSWRLMPGISTLKWKGWPNPVDDLARASRAVVAVKIENTRGETAAKIPVLVLVEGKEGPRTLRGSFTQNADWPLPRPWGPPEGAPVVFDLEDVYGVVEAIG